MLLRPVKASAVSGSSTYIASILRHVVEEPHTLRSIMQHTIKRYFDQSRSRSVDIGAYVRNCSAMALRNLEIFWKLLDRFVNLKSHILPLKLVSRQTSLLVKINLPRNLRSKAHPTCRSMNLQRRCRVELSNLWSKAVPVFNAMSASEGDPTMEDAILPPLDADSDMIDATTAEASNAEQSSPDAPETSAESTSAQTAPPECVAVMIHGSPVDVTETGIDTTFLEALPDDMREEVLNQHVRDQRAARIERLPDSQISSEFIDALPPKIRAEIIQQEAVQRAQAQPGVGTEMDNASFLASLDPMSNR